MAESHRMRCDCFQFGCELEHFSKDLLAEKDGLVQWNIFREFLMKHVTDDTHEIQEFMEEDKTNEQFKTSCSLKICSLLAHKLQEFRSRDIAVSTLFMDLMTILNYKFCARFYIRRTWDFENSTQFLMERDTLRVLSSFKCHWNANSGRHEVGKPFMELLLNFGFLSSLRNDSPSLTKQLDSILHYIMVMHLNDSDDETEDDYNNHIENIKNKAIKLVKDILFLYVGRETHKRIFLAGKAIVAISEYLKGEDTVAEWIISRLNLYFIGTRDVMLSVLELRTVLHVYLELTNKLDRFDKYCEEIDTLMPQYPAQLEPRKLTHLARCEIRDNLKMSNLPLPSAVDKVVSSKILKIYLLGEVADLTRKVESVA